MRAELPLEQTVRSSIKHTIFCACVKLRNQLIKIVDPTVDEYHCFCHYADTLKC